VVRADPALVYVPNSKSNSVDVIDQATYRIVGHFAVGGLPQHVVPSYDLRTLWVNNNDGYTLTPIDPRTGRPGRAAPVADPYNLYFTTDGRYSIVMAEARQQIIFSDPHTMRPEHVLAVPGCNGVNHADFSADGRYFIATCEFAGRLIKVDVVKQQLVGTLPLAPKAMPQDIKIAPDGAVWYVADMNNNGVWVIDGDSFRKIGFIPTGKGAHGLCPRRDAKVLYVTNRGEGSISLLSFVTRKVVGKWRIPGGGSPDMGGLNDRHHPVAFRPLRRRRVRDQHRQRPPRPQDCRRSRAARAVRLPPAGTLLPRPHRHPALTGSCRSPCRSARVLANRATCG